jgi:hypothetical protein
MPVYPSVCHVFRREHEPERASEPLPLAPQTLHLALTLAQVKALAHTLTLTAPTLDPNPRRQSEY